MSLVGDGFSLCCETHAPRLTLAKERVVFMKKIFLQGIQIRDIRRSFHCSQSIPAACAEGKANRR